MMDYYYYLHHELFNRGYDADTLSSKIYDIISQLSCKASNRGSNRSSVKPAYNQSIISTDYSWLNELDNSFSDVNDQTYLVVIEQINKILDHFAPDYVYDNHQLTNMLVYSYTHQESYTSNGYYQDNLFPSTPNVSLIQSNSNHYLQESNDGVLKSIGGIVSSLEENDIDDVRIDTFRCIDLSVNAACYDPNNVSSSYTSSSLSSNSHQDLKLLHDSQTIDGSDMANLLNAHDFIIQDFASENEDLSCLQTDLTFNIAYLESILHEQITTQNVGNSPISPSNLTPVITNFSYNALEMALFLSNIDVFVAADIILTNAKAISSSKPCLHAKNGGKCYRRDCYFDHDFSSLPCKFWFSSVDGCILKDCPFLHGLVVAENQKLVDLKTDKKIEKKPVEHVLEINDELFPALSATGKPARSRKNSCSSFDSDSSLTSSSASAVSKDIDPKLSLSFTFKRSPTELSANGSTASGMSSNNKAINKSTKSALSTSSHKITSSVITEAVVKEGLKMRSKDFNNALNTSKVSKNAWVDSGSGVSMIYQECREEARKLAIMRNKLLEEATKAYISGLKDVAKSLSRQGQELNLKMKEYHLQAARKIFQAKNSKASIMRGQIDLHGLHISEARICVEELIPYLRSFSISAVSIVTGSGHHTLGPQQGNARVLPAIIDLCNENGWEYQQISDHNKYVGGLRITIN